MSRAGWYQKSEDGTVLISSTIVLLNNFVLWSLYYFYYNAHIASQCRHLKCSSVYQRWLETKQIGYKLLTSKTSTCLTTEFKYSSYNTFYTSRLVLLWNGKVWASLIMASWPPSNHKISNHMVSGITKIIITSYLYRLNITIYSIYN